MALTLLSEHLNGIKLFKPIVFSDDRGFFMETFRYDDLFIYGINREFLQDNHSGSVKNTLRGMHFQWDKPQGKLIRVTAGEAMVVEIDIRKDSPTLGKYHSFKLSSDNKNILWVPPGFANGFLSLSDWVEVQYKCTAVYNPQGETGIRWNDPDISINWNCENPILSEKDMKAQSLSEWLEKDESNINWD